MSCLNDELLGEVIDGVAAAATLAHLENCDACSERVEAMQGLGALLRAVPLARERAPAAVVGTLRGLEAGASSEGRRRWRAFTGFVAAAAAAAVLVVSPTGGGVPVALADEAVSHHLRSFANGTAWEMESTDPAQVASWLSTGLGQEVQVPTRPGLELVGARRCSLFGERAGAVIYRDVAGTAVTMFVPAPGSAAERACERAVGECSQARDGQTVCVVEGEDGSPRVLVGELPAAQLCQVAQG
ncbi:anti-sigma factor family protein [Vulgatibacter sp.]|uniref:anti-sigma factor family protein n=1 Tax=Vulgatibacter sp. TaxID=1971226 RepID=UPI003562D3B1